MLIRSHLRHHHGNLAVSKILLTDKLANPPGRPEALAADIGQSRQDNRPPA